MCVLVPVHGMQLVAVRGMQLENDPGRTTNDAEPAWSKAASMLPM